MATMTSKHGKLIGLFVIIMMLFIIAMSNYTRQYTVHEITIDTISTDTIVNDTVFTDLTKDSFYRYCAFDSIRFPDVVWAQARHESGNFSSPLYRNKNNFLGLYDSRRKQYMEFDHWTDCLTAYRRYVQYKYTGRDEIGEYISWLEDMGYAEDPEYTVKIERMMRCELALE